MIRKWITSVNYGIAGLIALLLLVALIVMFLRPSSIIEPNDGEGAKKSKTLPEPIFAQPEKANDALGEPLLSLEFVPPRMQIPDLRPYLSYYGTNVRPDTAQGQTLLHFGLTGGSFGAAQPAQPLYLMYDRSQSPGKYVFSPENGVSNLWIVAEPKDNTALVKVNLRDEEGQQVLEPRARADLTLQEKEFARFGGGTWEIGKYRVDGTLLARQRARWFGQDQFLNAHGGEEYKDFENKERIEFGDGDDRYSVYAGVGDCLIWDGQKWKSTKDVPDSRTYPLLCVKGVDERLMRLELWDVGGKGRVALSLLRSTEPWAPKAIQRDFKFVSARTLSQYVFDVRNERTTLRPQDWLLLTEKGWKRLESAEDIDAYVDRKTPGVLFVFEGITKKDDRQILVATLYNSSRTAAEQIEIPLDQGGPTLSSPSAPAPQNQQASQSMPEQPLQQQTQPQLPQVPVEPAPQSQVPSQSIQEAPVEQPPVLPQEPLSKLKTLSALNVVVEEVAIRTPPTMIGRTNAIQAAPVRTKIPLIGEQGTRIGVTAPKKPVVQADQPKVKVAPQPISPKTKADLKNANLPTSPKQEAERLKGLPIKKVKS